MPGVTEIYICKPGQDLKQGKLETSSRISGKEDAECDAEQRCKLDPTIDRIAYYAVDAGGTFRSFFTYKNPRASAPAPAPKARPARGGAIKATAVTAPIRRKKPAPSLFQRVRALFEED